jgi:hypothetical protein
MARADWINGAGKMHTFSVEETRRAEAICEGQALTAVKLWELKVGHPLTAEQTKSLSDGEFNDCIGRELSTWGHPITVEQSK